MKGVVLDTHALVWYLNIPEKLSLKASATIDKTLNSGGFLYLSVISMVELVYLTEKGKISDRAMNSLRIALQNPVTGVRAIPVTIEVSECLHGIPRIDVPDMPDRIIAATAIYLNLPLVTRDAKIRSSKVKTVW